MCHGCHPSANVIKLAITSTRSLAYKSRRKQRGRGRRGEQNRGETQDREGGRKRRRRNVKKRKRRDKEGGRELKKKRKHRVGKKKNRELKPGKRAEWTKNRSTQKAGGGRRKYRKTEAASPAYHRPSSSSPPPAAPLAPAAPPRSHCREARTLLTGETKYRGNRQHGEAEERRKRSNVCHHSWLPRQQRHREPSYQSISIPGNTLLLLLVCPVGLLHAERVLFTFLQQGK